MTGDSGELSAQVVQLELAGPRATITLDSPGNRNALSAALGDQLLAHLETIERAAAADDGDLRVVLLRSSGRVFCAGADLAEATRTGMLAGARRMVAIQRAIVSCRVPVLAIVSGPVRAGGLGIVAAADLAVSTTSASFALTEVRLGLAAATISLTVVARMGPRAAARAILTGAEFDGAEAARASLVTAAVDDDDLDRATEELVTQLLQGHPQGLRESKRLLNAELLADIDTRGEQLAATSAELFDSPAAQQAMRAFLSGRR